MKKLFVIGLGLFSGGFLTVILLSGFILNSNEMNLQLESALLCEAELVECSLSENEPVMNRMEQWQQTRIRKQQERAIVKAFEDLKNVVEHEYKKALYFASEADLSDLLKKRQETWQHLEVSSSDAWWVTQDLGHPLLEDFSAKMVYSDDSFFPFHVRFSSSEESPRITQATQTIIDLIEKQVDFKANRAVLVCNELSLCQYQAMIYYQGDSIGDHMVPDYCAALRSSAGCHQNIASVSYGPEQANTLTVFVSLDVDPSHARN